MKLSIFSIIFTIAAMTSLAHADPLQGKNISCDTVPQKDNSVFALEVESNYDGTYSVNGCSAGKNGDTPNALTLENRVGGEWCKLDIDLSTGEGSWHYIHISMDPFNPLHVDFKADLKGCKVDK